MDRVGQLRTMASDVTKTDSDILNYSKEFLELQLKMDNAAASKLNGVDLFVFQQNSLSSQIKSVADTYTNQDGSTESLLRYTLELKTGVGAADENDSMEISVVNMLFILNPTTTVLDGKLTSYSQSMIDEVGKRLLDARAENGAQQKDRTLEIDNFRSLSSDLELAKSRVMDADLARQTTETVKENVIMQVSSSMFTQAKESSNRDRFKINDHENNFSTNTFYHMEVENYKPKNQGR